MIVNYFDDSIRLTADQAARRIVFEFGGQWTVMGIDEFQVVDPDRLTHREEVSIFSAAKRHAARIERLLFPTPTRKTQAP